MTASSASPTAPGAVVVASRLVGFPVSIELVHLLSTRDHLETRT